MSNLVEIRWILLLPALPAVAFLIWVFVNLARDRMRKHERRWNVSLRRRHKGGIWE